MMIVMPVIMTHQLELHHSESEWVAYYLRINNKREMGVELVTRRVKDKNELDNHNA